MSSPAPAAILTKQRFTTKKFKYKFLLVLWLLKVYTILKKKIIFIFNPLTIPCLFNYGNV